MRIAIVNAKDLGNDWRPSAHCVATKEDFQNAKTAGWECGTRGAKNITSPWAKHGKEPIRATFREAYEAGLKARKEYLK